MAVMCIRGFGCVSCVSVYLCGFCVRERVFFGCISLKLATLRSPHIVIRVVVVELYAWERVCVGVLIVLRINMAITHNKGKCNARQHA